MRFGTHFFVKDKSIRHQYKSSLVTVQELSKELSLELLKPLIPFSKLSIQFISVAAIYCINCYTPNKLNKRARANWIRAHDSPFIQLLTF